jgi:hypothetical protein
MIKRILLSIPFIIFSSLAHANGPLPEAKGTPLLTITVGQDTHLLDADALRQLPREEFETTTIWTEGPQAFAGVRMTEILDRLDIDTGQMLLTAANGYQITIPVADFTPDGALIAYERNGQKMSLRDKGPLWLVYPYDSGAKFRTEIIYASSIWQLDRITIQE